MEINVRFRQELTDLINRHSIDNDTNTPDFILSQMMCRTIQDVYELNESRDKWFGKGQGFHEVQETVVDNRPVMQNGERSNHPFDQY